MDDLMTYITSRTAMEETIDYISHQDAIDSTADVIAGLDANMTSEDRNMVNYYKKYIKGGHH